VEALKALQIARHQQMILFSIPKLGPLDPGPACQRLGGESSSVYGVRACTCVYV
jgi:hypothetical protein